MEKEAFFKTGLRAISYSEGVTEINSGTMEKCPRLVSVSFPSTLRRLGANAFSNSIRMSAISCRAIEAPEAESGAFNGILTQKCTLTVPAAGFHNYLNALQWGMFGKLECSVDVVVPDDVDATMLPEDEYREIQEEERLEELMEEMQSETEELASAGPRAARRASREALSSGRYYAKVFNGASVNSPANGMGNRVFLNLTPGQELKAVLLNGVDITSQLDDNSILLPAGTQGKLEIRLDTSDIDDITGTEVAADEICDVYNMAGMKVFTGRRSDFSGSKGIYLLRGESGTTSKFVVK